MGNAPAQLIRRLQDARTRLAATKIEDPALAICVAGMARLEEVLARPLRVVILGEYNSGKTSVADLLIGNGLLPTSVVSNTKLPVLITYAKTPALHGVDVRGALVRIDSRGADAPMDASYEALQVALPLERLQGFQILDTPSMVKPDTFVRDADIVIWCTVATRAWTESERATWSALPKRCRRNAMLVVTHKNALNGEEEARHVTERLREVTQGLFRDVLLIDAAGEAGAASPMDGGGDDLSARLRRCGEGIGERRAQKAEKIVRRLARLAFHDFARRDVRSDAAPLLASWESGAARLLDDLRQRRKPVPEVIEDLLAGFGVFAEQLRPGVVTGGAVSGTSETSRAVAAPLRWPQRHAAAVGLIAMLVSDLTGILRMLAAPSSGHDERRVARAILLGLADLDGAFDALGRLMGPATATPTCSAAG
ncbi:hypothetical protein W911_09065 [Hyphomicrobium nitrativorans NL23]|uniref:G domain-containing protein n=1 Tax=Hyphomicrobium nitrativorans NL23 TaxID=1029756 RepID=V5SJK2_9HYPH|nr:hypothetical protein [Hyphomicrobium nitrativorans]AHB50139.1 hypothetical protein W911_09065 [Hyphomicrobium nitrativorans NL23]